MLKEYRSEFHKFSEIISLVDLLLEETDLINDVEKYPDGQLALQTDLKDVDDWCRGVGKVTGKQRFWERTFNKIQPRLRGSVIEEYIDWLGIPVFRSRIMVSRSKSSYSFHRDLSPRLHLPLITNDQCRFVFTDPAEIIHMPANGKTFWVDTRKEHTFVNGSTDARIHLVMVVLR